MPILDTLKAYLFQALTALFLLLSIGLGIYAVIEHFSLKNLANKLSDANKVIALKSYAINELNASLQRQNNAIKALEIDIEKKAKEYQTNRVKSQNELNGLAQKYKNTPECEALKDITVDFIRSRQ